MTEQQLSRLIARVVSAPTAPYHEYHVRQEIESICAEHHLKVMSDRFGNLLVRVCTAPKLRPIVFAAHMDHPGFEIVRPVSGSCWLARFNGGVPESYFRPGIPLLLMPGSIPAKLGRPAKEAKTFLVRAAKKPVIAPAFGVWSVPNFRLEQGRIVARACDDLIGVAAVLGTLIRLARKQAAVHAIGLLSRAEEVGFQGALAAAAGKTLPANSLVVSLETSRELPGVKMGEGVILRVGDRASTFDPEANRFLSGVAAELKTTRKSFKYQRALMGGGTCEATAYQEHGYQSAAVCVALGNYHNAGQRDKILPEYVSLTDVCSMVDFLVELAIRSSRYSRYVAELRQRLRGLLRQARKELRRPRGQPKRLPEPT